MKKITWEDRYNEWEALFQYLRDNEAELIEKGRMPAMVLCLQRTWADYKKLKGESQCQKQTKSEKKTKSP